jgi:hypothetical protein
MSLRRTPLSNTFVNVLARERCAPCSCMRPLRDATVEGRLVEIQRLLTSGEANVGDTDLFGTTALHLAAKGGHLGIVQWLVQHGGAGVDKKDSEEYTPLLIAALYERLDVVQWLLQRGGAHIDDASELLRLTVWDLLQQRLHQNITLLKVMVARAAPPLNFVNALPADLRPILLQGEVIRPRLPSSSHWRKQRSTALYESDFNAWSKVFSIVEGYAEVSDEELWEVLEQEQATELSSSREGQDARD